MVAAGFSTASAILNCVTMLILRIQVDENHANITNEELDWKRELEKRELVSISGPAGSLLQKRTHLKYKKVCHTELNSSQGYVNLKCHVCFTTKGTAWTVELCGAGSFGDRFCRVWLPG